MTDIYEYVYCACCGRRRMLCKMKSARTEGQYICFDHVECDKTLEKMEQAVFIEFPSCCFVCSLHIEPEDDPVEKAYCEPLNLLINEMPGGKCPPTICPLRNIKEKEDA